MLDGLAAARGTDANVTEQLSTTLQRLAPRWFVVRNAHVAVQPLLMQPRYAMSLMRGPMTRVEIRAARGVGDGGAGKLPVDAPKAAPLGRAGVVGAAASEA